MHVVDLPFPAVDTSTPLPMYPATQLLVNSRDRFLDLVAGPKDQNVSNGSQVNIYICCKVDGSFDDSTKKCKQHRTNKQTYMVPKPPTITKTIIEQTKTRINGSEASKRGPAFLQARTTTRFGRHPKGDVLSCTNQEVYMWQPLF